MKLYKPTQILAFKLLERCWYTGLPWVDTNNSGPAICPLFSRFLEELEVEGRFSQTHHRRENFVHHTKVEGLYNNIPPFLVSERATYGSHSGQQLRIVPLLTPELIDDSSTCAAWICRPGYSFIIRGYPTDRIYGYCRAYYFEAYILKADYSNGRTAELLQYRYLTNWYNPSKNYFYSDAPNDWHYNDADMSSDFVTYLLSQIQGLPSWSLYDHGSNNDAGSYEVEKRWSLTMFSKVVNDIYLYERLAIEAIKSFSSYSSSRLYVTSPNTPDFKPPSTLFGEENILDREDLILCSYLPAYVFESLRQQSFLSACEAAPSMSDNSISNIFELTTFIYDLVVRHEINIPKSLSDIWLAYRYQYTTTKLDVEEAIQFVNRHVDSSMWDKGLKCYGEATTSFGGASVTMRSTIVMAKREMSQIRQIWDKLRTYGLTPDFYVIWDMLPYSFIVDWFIPAGDVLNVIDQSLEYTEEHYDFKKIVYSLTYRLHDENNFSWKVYTRWPEEHPPSLSGFYWFIGDQVGMNTIQMRALDTVSLIVGHLKGG